MLRFFAERIWKGIALFRIGSVTARDWPNATNIETVETIDPERTAKINLQQ